MKLLSHRNGLLLGAGVTCLSVGFGFAACSSSSGGNGGGPGGTNGSSLLIQYSPMYSAFVPGGSEHFKVPVRILGASLTNVTWDYDKTVVQADTEPLGNIAVEMFTVIGAPSGGSTVIKATAGGVTAMATLYITSATMDQWMTGDSRYNNSVTLPPLPTFGCGQPPPNFNFMMGGPSIFEPADGGPGPACTNCHGPTATAGMYQGIEHTPLQTAGFSDSDLKGIFEGNIPDGGTYDPTIIPYFIWQSFHKWTDLTADQQTDMVIYLRSIPPMEQGGKFDFGGFGDGGFGPPVCPEEAGTAPPEEAGMGGGDATTTTTQEAGTQEASTTVLDAGTASDAGDATPE